MLLTRSKTLSYMRIDEVTLKGLLLKDEFCASLGHLITFTTLNPDVSVAESPQAPCLQSLF